ncbi:hypothetical protein CDD81_1295 [Ophiocordyceps australis]|uniref:Uncharacterized protein n=1 Tax=Ophiocordyceps australis TaxID=1399860 RepID=A0A2C5XWC0_9HYPO|nr:hypothetical protein CDD81_1295 [Ophiocordyceps australis]
MDFVKKAVDSAKGGKEPTKEAGEAGKEGGKEAGGDDYVDKAFSAAAKKSGHNIDRETQEKITDGGRTAYEKMTGSKVNPKISN